MSAKGDEVERRPCCTIDRTFELAFGLIKLDS